MPEYVRAKVKDTGAHVTITSDEYDTFKSGYELLKGDAVDMYGRPLPEKPRVELAPATRAAPTARRRRASKKTAAAPTTSASSSAATNTTPTGDGPSVDGDTQEA